MCYHCNYTEMLSTLGMTPTPHRRRVLEVIGGNNYPLSAQEIYATLRRTQAINRVTVYRILDTLVENGIVQRLRGGGRAAYYGMAPNEHHQPHPHFYCKHCGQMNCLNPGSIEMDLKAFRQMFPGRIDGVELRIDGVCKDCLRHGEKRPADRSP